MASLKITIDSKTIDKRINKILSGIKNFKEPLNDASNELIKFIGKTNFEAEGKSLLGKTWKPLTVATLKMRKERRGHYARNPITTNRILTWTGALMKGFNKKVASMSATITNSVKYAKHVSVTRPIMAINNKTLGVVIKPIQTYIHNLIIK